MKKQPSQPNVKRRPFIMRAGKVVQGTPIEFERVVQPDDPDYDKELEVARMYAIHFGSPIRWADEEKAKREEEPLNLDGNAESAGWLHSSQMKETAQRMSRAGRCRMDDQMDDDIVTFRNSEAAHLRWLEQHPSAYVINTTQSSPHNYMTLHRATCWHISRYTGRAAPGGFTEREYIKVCSPTKAGVERWAAQWGRSIETLGGCYCLMFS